MKDLQTAQRAHRDYVESKIETAHPVEIVHILYQVAIDSLNTAIAHLRSGDAFARARAVTKAELAVDELILSLDHSVGAPFTKTLSDLYGYVLQQTVTGHAKKSEQAFREALSILTTLSEGWAGVRDQICKDAPRLQLEEDTPQTVPSTHNHPYSAYGQSPTLAAIGSRDWSL